ncbi:MAG: Rrf2 family transcriptional regulator [Candidatus Rokubacteria bacterium]|nr:Rrf2 family transcriptional regulator [Candidatus Rokubacteria bacterium]
MLRFTKRADYGLMAINYIVVRGADGAVSAKRIAEEFGIPPELLAKILQRLAKKGFITSHNGPKGGYVLARSPEEMTVGEVVRALEGPIHIVNCLEDVDCAQFPRCNLRRPVQKIQASISYLLDTMTLAELTRETIPTADLTTVN